MLECEDRRFDDAQSIISLGLPSEMFCFLSQFSEIKFISYCESRIIDTSGKIESHLILKIKLLSFLLINIARELC